MTGTSYDIVVLSSSPPEARDAVALRPLSPASAPQRRVAMPATSSRSLSPLPSPQRPPPGALRSGSRAVPVPEGASRGFATARSLLADIDISGVGLSAIEQAIEARRAPTGPEGTIKATKPRKPRAKKAVDGEAAAEKPKAKRGRNPKASNAEQPLEGVLHAGVAATATSSHFARASTGNAATEAEVPPSEPKTVKTRKPRAKKTATDGGEIQVTITPAKVTKPRAPRKTSKKAQDKAAEVVSAHFRSRDLAGDTAVPEQHQLATTTEAGPSAIGGESIWEITTGPPARSRGPPKQKPPDVDLNLPLDLDAAVERRREWTPPADTVREDMFTSSISKDHLPGAMGADSSAFTSLLSGFTCAQLGDQSEQQTAKEASVEAVNLTKRRRMDLFDVSNTHGTSRQASPDKGKAPKKKPRTITDLVTGQYAPEPLPEPQENTSDFFARRTPTVMRTTKVPLNDTTEGESSKPNKKPVRRRSASKDGGEKAVAKPKAKKTSAKAAAKPKPVAEKLLSPTSAAFRLNRQEILFGTSSQLALDESPTMVREIQHALRESEKDASSLEIIRAADLAVGAWPRLKRLEGRRALWRASSRNDEGGMLEKQSVYLPEPDRTQDFPLLFNGTHELQESDQDDGFLDIENIEPLPEAKPDDSFLDIDDFLPPAPTTVKEPIAISSDLPTPPPTITEFTGTTKDPEPHSPSFYDIDDFLQDSNPPTSGQTYDHEPSFLDIDDFMPSTQPPRPPSASGSPTKKRRGRPPKTHSAIPSKPPASAPAPAQDKSSAPPPLPASAPPRTPRRRPDRFIHVEEILDSEDDAALSPTPPRIRNLPKSPPLTFSLARSSSLPSNTALPAPRQDAVPNPAPDPEPQPTAKPRAKSRTKKDISTLTPIFSIAPSYLDFETLRPTLFAAITSLVRNLPPSNDHTHPSWYEKILMYDALGVEEFTAWLGGFRDKGLCVWKRAGKGQVREWEKAGGKVEEVGGMGEKAGDKGWERGGEMGDGEMEEERVLVVRKELEAWMVQRWCEENSVCVVSREKKGGGARRGLY